MTVWQQGGPVDAGTKRVLDDITELRETTRELFRGDTAVHRSAIERRRAMRGLLTTTLHLHDAIWEAGWLTKAERDRSLELMVRVWAAYWQLGLVDDESHPVKPRS